MAGDYVPPASLHDVCPESSRMKCRGRLSLLFLLFVFPAGAQLAHDVAGSSAADQICARFASGSATSAPPELRSQNGVLEMTFKFLTTTDSQGLVRYCYVTDTGLEAQTDPGTAKGTYTVVVTGTAGSGSSQYQTSVNVPITIQ
jgi:hypothetical protein